MTILCGCVLAGAPAVAASDYYLKLGDIKGESMERAAGRSGEVLSWSWGTSNAGSARTGSGMGAGKVAMQDLSVAAAAVQPRDAASGLPTGKRQHKPMAAAVDATGGTTDATADVADATVRSVSIVMAAGDDSLSQQLDRACTGGKHIEKAELRAPGQQVEMTDVVVASCTVAGKQRQYELRGHVTLIK
jgi:type VI secretion system secreted protein Hcp